MSRNSRGEERRADCNRQISGNDDLSWPRFDHRNWPHLAVGFRPGEHLLWRTQTAGAGLDDVGAEGEVVDDGRGFGTGACSCWTLGLWGRRSA